MNIVYLIEFVDRKQNNEKPYYYIGSKSNCVIRDGVMYGNRKKAYWGSSDDKEMTRLIPIENKCVHVLFSNEDYNTCLEMEKTIHIERDVVADPIYFNKSVAMCNNYSHPDYATYKNTETGKVARLPRNHEKVLNGEWVGVTKGIEYSEERKMMSSRPGEKHPLFGTTCSEERKGKISKSHLKNHEEDPEKYAAHYSWLGSLVSARTKGVKQPQSVIDKRTEQIKNNVVMRNKITGELKTFKNTTDEYKNLDTEIWEYFRTGHTQLKNKDTGEIKDFIIDSDEYRNIDRTIWIHQATNHVCLKNIQTGENKYFCKDSDEYTNRDCDIWKATFWGMATLKNRITKELRNFEKSSVEYKNLDRTVWVGVTYNTITLSNSITCEKKRFEKGSDEYKSLDRTIWVVFTSGTTTLKNLTTGESKRFNTISDEYKTLDRTIWVGSKHNRITLKNIQTGECKMFEKDSKELVELDRETWIWPTTYAAKNKKKEDK